MNAPAVMESRLERDVLVSNIPQELAERDQWCVWKTEERTDKNTDELKPTKVLKNPRTGGNAQSTNPETWSSFEVALSALETGKYDGLGDRAVGAG
jgi:putative DNA primase/helicase